MELPHHVGPLDGQDRARGHGRRRCNRCVWPSTSATTTAKSSCARQFPHLYTSASPAGAETVPRRISQSRRLSSVARTQRRPIIRSITHAPDHTVARPRLLHGSSRSRRSRHPILSNPNDFHFFSWASRPSPTRFRKSSQTPSHSLKSAELSHWYSRGSAASSGTMTRISRRDRRFVSGPRAGRHGSCTRNKLR